MLGRCKRCVELEKDILRAKAEVSDIKSLFLEREQAHLNERKELLDRVMVLTNPASVREVHRIPIERKEAQKIIPKYNIPGDKPLPRPPVINKPSALLERIKHINEN